MNKHPIRLNYFVMVIHFIACFLSLTSLVQAQVPIPITVEIQVTDERDMPLPNVRVEIGSITSGMTDEHGNYRVEIQVPPGSYGIFVRRPGYRQLTKPLQVSPDQAGTTIRISFRLEQLYMAAPPPPAPPWERVPNYAIVKVFYATDRASTGSAEPAVFFGSDRAAQAESNLSYGTCDVSIPRDHQMGQLEAPSIWKLEFREDPEKHVVLLKVTSQEPEGFFRDLSARIGQSKEKEAFVFIHGYATTFEDAARRTAQLQYDLGFDGAPIFYSWPSQGSRLKYTVDETNVEWTTPHLKAFLEKIVVDSQAKKVHLIAHSMGNRALTRALKEISAEEGSHGMTRFHQVVLAAPDIDADVFRQLAVQIKNSAERVTLYASSNDEALVASKIWHGYPRAGDSGERLVIVPGIDTLDVSDIDTSLLGHSYYGDNRSILADLHRLLQFEFGPDRRSNLFPKDTLQGRYWVFSP